jgi:hypothetical protein
MSQDDYISKLSMTTKTRIMKPMSISSQYREQDLRLFDSIVRSFIQLVRNQVCFDLNS